MGIFDDAIREHLELKRHAGADEEELKEMEDEAFGPPARPGDPDFPSSTSEEAAVESDEPEGELEESPTAEAEAAPAQGVFDGETPDDAVIEAPSEEEPALTPIEETTVLETEEEPAAPESAEPESAPEPEDAAPAPEPEDPPAENEPVDPADAPTFTTAEREAIADQPTVFFEQQPPADLELGELELDLDEEIEEVGGSVSEPLPEEEQLIVEEAFAEPAEAEVAEPPHEVEPDRRPSRSPRRRASHRRPRRATSRQPRLPRPAKREPATTTSSKRRLSSCATTRTTTNSGSNRANQKTSISS